MGVSTEGNSRTELLSQLLEGSQNKNATWGHLEVMARGQVVPKQEAAGSSEAGLPHVCRFAW